MFRPITTAALLALLQLAGGCQWIAPFASEATRADSADANPVDRGLERARDAGADVAPDTVPDGAPDGPPSPATHLWSQRIGQAGALQSALTAVDNSGNVYAAGVFRGAVDLGGGPLVGGGLDDIFVASFDADGAHRWSHAFGGPKGDEALAIAADASGNTYVTGVLRGAVDFGGGLLAGDEAGDVFVASFDSDGVHRWSQRHGSGGEQIGRAIAVDASGAAVYIAGHFANVIDFNGTERVSAGGHDIFLASLAAADGAYRWSRGFGGSGDDEAVGVAVDGAGDVAITGRFEGSVNFGGGALTSAGASDVFIVSFDGDDEGNLRWASGFGGPLEDAGLALAVDATGAVYVTGIFRVGIDFGGGELSNQGLTDIFVAKRKPNGVHEWAKALGSSSDDRGLAIAADASGNIYVAGHFSGLVDFGGDELVANGTDAFLASYTAAGAHRWSQPFGMGGPDGGTSIAADAGGNVTFAGHFDSAISFSGGAVILGTGWDNVFLASRDPQGEARWHKTFGGTTMVFARHVAAPPGGGALVAGICQRSVSVGDFTRYGASENDIFVAAFDGQGAPDSPDIFGDSGADVVHGLAAAPTGEVLLTGTFDGTVDFGAGVSSLTSDERDIFVASLAGSGAHRWAHAFTSAELDVTSGVAVDAAGDVTLAGYFHETLDLGGGPLACGGEQDVFLAHFDVDGGHLWSQCFGGAAHQGSSSVAVDPLGNILVAGWFAESVDFGGQLLQNSGSNDAVYLASFTAAGDHRWSRAFSNDNNVAWPAVALDASGNAYLVCHLNGAIDLGGGTLSIPGSLLTGFVASYTADGAHRWSQAVGRAGSAVFLRAVAASPAGQVFVTGSFSGSIELGQTLTSAGEDDVLVASFAAGGALRWSRAFGGPGVDQGQAITATEQAVLVVGQFAQRVDFGGGPLHSAGASFVAALVP